MSNEAQNQISEQWFLGEYENTIDKQRRIAIPSLWRSSAPEDNHFFLLPGPNESLQLVPAEWFQELLQRLRKVSFGDRQAQVAMATIGSMAQECVCDKQGRISIPSKLMNHANLSDSAILIGAVTEIQIWEPQRWEQNRMDSDTGLDVLQQIQKQPDEFSEFLKQFNQ